MVSVPPHFDNHSRNSGGCYTPGSNQPGGVGGRLNLLVSCASWRADTWADALPRLLEPMGVSAVRARSARQAEQLIRHQPVHIAVVDLGLPLNDAQADEAEEAGVRVLDLLFRLDAPPPTVVVRSSRTTRESSRDLTAALKCGAFAVVDRQAATLELMLSVMQRCLHRFYAGRWPVAES